MKEKIVRYGRFKTANDYEHCLAAVQYEDELRFNFEKGEFEKAGETIMGVWNIRGGLNYAKKYGLTKCQRFGSLQALIDDDLAVFPHLNIELYEPVEI